MTKQELIDVVNRIYYMWNQTPPVTNQKDLYEAWWVMLHDLPQNETLQAATTLSALDGYMPRPGTLRRKTIEQQGITPPPTPIEAWTQYRHISNSINNGTYEPQLVHDTLATVIKKIGIELHTNGDREQFIKTYEKEVEEWTTNTYTPPQT